MNTWERFRKIRKQKSPPFGFRFRLTFFVTLEMLICIVIAHFLDKLINHVIPLNWTFPMALEMVITCLLVGIVATSQLSRYFFHPIKKIRAAMDQVADGDFTVQLKEKSSLKEVREINTGFNLMVQELNATEILQTDFVSNVSHEFKTPINAIEGYSTLLQDSDNLNDEQREYVNKILFNTQRLSSLTSSILLLSKLENQQIPTGKNTYRLDEQIRQSIVALEPAWEQKNIEFEADMERLTYHGNEAMMHHVWNNLISNAIKFSPADSVICMKLYKDEDRIVFSVSDQGPGLPEEAQKHIFDKFYQADNSHKQEGNGLGLTLVKRILAIENGEIDVENLAQGGCKFTVYLP